MDNPKRSKRSVSTNQTSQQMILDKIQQNVDNNKKARAKIILKEKQHHFRNVSSEIEQVQVDNLKNIQKKYLDFNFRFIQQKSKTEQSPSHILQQQFQSNKMSNLNLKSSTEQLDQQSYELIKKYSFQENYNKMKEQIIPQISLKPLDITVKKEGEIHNYKNTIQIQKFTTQPSKFQKYDQQIKKGISVKMLQITQLVPDLLKEELSFDIFIKNQHQIIKDNNNKFCIWASNEVFFPNKDKQILQINKKHIFSISVQQNLLSNERENIYIIILITNVVKQEQEIGWYGHKIYNNDGSLNFGEFQVNLWNPPLQSSFPVLSQQLQSLATKLNFEIKDVEYQ